MVGAVYVGNTWSPSSYGHVLVNHLGFAHDGPVWGHARHIRSDEWAVVTPLTQAAVNNGFARYNHTSLYGEDLRMNYGLPIRDWGMVFKPTLWLYGWANPAYAYSLHWFLLAALFVLGYAWLFRWLGAAPVVGFALSAGLYFSGFVQFWWNEKGSEFALFPWVILPFATRLPLVWKALLFYWAAVVWLLADFYPPVQVSLAFVGLVLLLAREPDLFRPRPLVALALAAALAAGTAALYLWDYLLATAATLYPGERSVSGGTVPWRYWISWLWPAANFDREYQPFIGPNICETGTLGLYYSLLVLCFLDFARWRDSWQNAEWRRLVVVLGIGMLMMLAWMTLPLPSWAGAPLLWNNVQPERMQYAGGLLLVLLLFTLAHSLGLQVSGGRLAVFSGAVLLGWWAWKYEAGKNRHEDLIVLAVFLPAYALARRRPGAAHACLAVASLSAGIFLFGRFNPLQSAWPIFNRSANTMTVALDRLAEYNGGVLAVLGLPGAVGNGLGYRSLSHVTAVPQLGFWRRHFPDMPAGEFEAIFNRYSHIVPMNVSVPRLRQADAVIVPVSLYQKAAAVSYIGTPSPSHELGGHVDNAVIEGRNLIISGWGTWTGPLPAQELEMALEPPAQAAPLRAVVVRPDLPGATGNPVSALNGFTLAISLPEQGTPRALCVFSHDASTGVRRLLQNPPGVPNCQLAAAPL